MPAGKRFLFICGCPRSGTTALWKLLTASPHVVLGLERYSSRMISRWRWLSPALFEYERFFRLRRGDTFYDDLEAFHPYYRTARARWHDATFVGDKLPRLYQRFPDLGRVFRRPRVLCIFRDIVEVAASYKRRAEDRSDATWGRSQGVHAAIADWTKAIAAFRAADAHVDVLPVVFDDLLVEGRGLDRICDFLELSDRAAMATTHQGLLARSRQIAGERTMSLTEEELETIRGRAPMADYATIVEEARREPGAS
jgi:hypothetical protein